MLIKKKTLCNFLADIYLIFIRVFLLLKSCYLECDIHNECDQSIKSEFFIAKENICIFAHKNQHYSLEEQFSKTIQGRKDTYYAFTYFGDSSQAEDKS